ncbi:hypothetical protein FLJC2902T_08360 [Flavobacterium limnosediminis JC2902]|uniref:Uncharacterized protein n=1 Tax=Flavobacterium limnosediminis JC2902 TaxID=1341181 RepID=V6SRU8_9FLAO|nr:hypothetical protein FLJC2902T_08360 [Flavobacterium limnosediminis JC2902]
MGIVKEFKFKEPYKFLTFNSNEDLALAAKAFGSLFTFTVTGLNDERNKNKNGNNL